MRTLLVVTGLQQEARIAAGPGVRTVVGGGRAERLEAILARIEPDTIEAVLSFGLAGALSPDLAVGDMLVPDVVISDTSRYPMAPAITERLAGRLAAAGIPVRRGALVARDEPALSARAKNDLFAATGAVAIDMESHVAARYAADRSLPFAVLRTISDCADRSLPPAAAVGMRPDGGMDIPAVLRSLLARPGQLPALLGTARDAGRAFRSLRRVRALLGPGRGLLGFDLG